MLRFWYETLKSYIWKLLSSNSWAQHCHSLFSVLFLYSHVPFILKQIHEIFIRLFLFRAILHTLTFVSYVVLNLWLCECLYLTLPKKNTTKWCRMLRPVNKFATVKNYVDLLDYEYCIGKSFSAFLWNFSSFCCSANFKRWVCACTSFWPRERNKESQVSNRRSVSTVFFFQFLLHTHNMNNIDFERSIFTWAWALDNRQTYRE